MAHSSEDIALCMYVEKYSEDGVHSWCSLETSDEEGDTLIKCTFSPVVASAESDVFS